MKTSELIKVLQDSIQKYGDRDIARYGSYYGTTEMFPITECKTEIILENTVLARKNNIGKLLIHLN